MELQMEKCIMRLSFPRQSHLICIKVAGDREGFCAEGAPRVGWGHLAWAIGGEAQHKGREPNMSQPVHALASKENTTCVSSAPSYLLS